MIFSIVVVDVVRTDSHLEFYEDTKNLARMSDILAVYAWVDPATGYCQGCSLLFSVVALVERMLCDYYILKFKLQRSQLYTYISLCCLYF